FRTAAEAATTSATVAVAAMGAGIAAIGRATGGPIRAAVTAITARPRTAQRHHRSAKAVELVLLFRMLAEDVVDVLAIRIGDLRLLEAAALLRITLLPLLREADVAGSGAGRGAPGAPARSAVATALSVASAAPPTTSATTTAAYVEALRAQLGHQGVLIHPEHGAGCGSLTRILDRIVRNGEHVVALVDQDRDFAVHAGTEELLVVLEVHQDGEHRHVLLDDGLRLDLVDHALEAPVGIGVDRDARLLARVHVADVRLVVLGWYGHHREIGHLHERRSTTHGTGRRRDDGPDGDVLRDDRPVLGRGDGGVLERLLGNVEVRLGVHDAGFRVLIIDRNLLVLLRRDDARLVHLFVALLVRFADLQLRLGGI